MPKFCPLCKRPYADEIERCEDDGVMLVVEAAADDLLGTVLDGRYEIASVLGEGGMGSVYRATQVATGREVAVKVLLPWYSRDKDAIQRFMREARAVSRLSHPNTIRVSDFGQSPEGHLYMVLELLTGRPLGRLLDQLGRLPAGRAAHVAAQVCESLAEAHELGIVHRDLKPDNLIVESPFGHADFVKVLDFGIASMGAEMKATKTGAIIGTPTYMSPEQGTAADYVDRRSDIYSLGIILYEMLTGAPPFRASSPIETVLKHVTDPVPPLPAEVARTTPGLLLWVVEKALAKEPSGRYDTCDAMRADLERVIEEGDEPGAGEAEPDEASAAERSTRQTTVTGNRWAPEPMRPTNLALQRVERGDRVALLATNHRQGVLQCGDPPPAVGDEVSLLGADPLIRQARARAEVLSHDAPGCVTVKWLKIGAPGARQLAGAVQRLLGVKLPLEQAALPALPEGEILAYDPVSGQVGSEAAWA